MCLIESHWFDLIWLAHCQRKCCVLSEQKHPTRTKKQRQRNTFIHTFLHKCWSQKFSGQCGAWLLLNEDKLALYLVPRGDSFHTQSTCSSLKVSNENWIRELDSAQLTRRKLFQASWPFSKTLSHWDVKDAGQLQFIGHRETLHSHILNRKAYKGAVIAWA